MNDAKLTILHDQAATLESEVIRAERVGVVDDRMDAMRKMLYQARVAAAIYDHLYVDANGDEARSMLSLLATSCVSVGTTQASELGSFWIAEAEARSEMPPSIRARLAGGQP